MPNFEQGHFYHVDPGKGEKSRDCPYSFYKDGRDIRPHIRPPRGYELNGFKYVPYDSDDFYEGKIIAQYKKMSLPKRIKKNPVAYLLSFVGIVGVLGALSYYFLKSQPNPTPMMPHIHQVNVATQDTTAQVSNSTMIAEVVLKEESVKEDVAVEEVIEEKTVEPVKEEKAQEEVAPIVEVVEPKEKEKEVVAKSNPEPKPTQETQPTSLLTKEQFHQEFWNLIHHKESHMSAYSSLYRESKDLNLKSKEFFYLYLTILEDGKAFNIWKDKLLSIPDDELKSIHTISALTEKIEQFE